MMLTPERRALLAERLHASGRLVTVDLADELEVSADTIRRDLRALAAQGVAQRVYGGALPASPALAPYGEREQVEPAAKRAVAGLAVALLRRGDTVILDGGTTALAVAAGLPRDLVVTVVTHSPTVAVALADRPLVEVQMLGGLLDRHSMVTAGAITADALRRVIADVAFVGVTGVHPVHGLTTGGAEEAAIKRLVVERAAETHVLASREKLGAVSPHVVSELAHVTGVLTDAPADHPVVARLLAAGVQVRVPTPVPDP